MLRGVDSCEAFRSGRLLLNERCSVVVLRLRKGAEMEQGMANG